MALALSVVPRMANTAKRTAPGKGHASRDLFRRFPPVPQGGNAPTTLGANREPARAELSGRLRLAAGNAAVPGHIAQAAP